MYRVDINKCHVQQYKQLVRHEFIQHPTDIITSQNDIGVMQLKLPRLKKHELASIRLIPTAQLGHYNGLSKLNPSLLPAVALSPEDTV